MRFSTITVALLAAVVSAAPAPAPAPVAAPVAAPEADPEPIPAAAMIVAREAVKEANRMRQILNLDDGSPCCLMFWLNDCSGWGVWHDGTCN